jgi:predicted RNase H-like HicB family nuclease
MRHQFTAIIGRDLQTGLYVGYVAGIPGAHSQGATLDELMVNLREVLELVLEDGSAVESEFVGTQNIVLA